MPRHGKRESAGIDPVRADADPPATTPGPERDIAPERVDDQPGRRQRREPPELGPADERLVGTEPLFQRFRRGCAAVGLFGYLGKPPAQVWIGHDSPLLRANLRLENNHMRERGRLAWQPRDWPPPFCGDHVPFLAVQAGKGWLASGHGPDHLA